MERFSVWTESYDKYTSVDEDELLELIKQWCEAGERVLVRRDGPGRGAEEED